MISPQFSITGMRYKQFDDGLGITVYYIRHDLNVTYIDLVRFEYNSYTVEQIYNCTYDHFQNFEGGTLVGDKGFDGFTRIQEMMRDLESELRSVNSEDILTESVDAINYDGTINLQAIGIKTQTDKPLVPKRQRTRWELLELD